MNAPASQSLVKRRLKQALWVSLVALLIHLTPLFWLNETPASRLERGSETKDLIKRAEILRPLEADTRATPAQLRVAAGLLLSVGASGDARFLAEAAVKREPDGLDGQLLLARVFSMEQMPQALDRVVTRAAAIAPGDVRAEVIHAEFLQREGKPQAAIATLRRAHERAPEATDVTARLAEALLVQGELTEAESLLQAVSPARLTPELLVSLAELRMKQGRIEEALSLLERAVEETPSLGKGHYALGVVHYRRGNIVGAERAFRRAAKFSPDDVRPLAALCTLQEDTGRIEAARLTGTELKRRFPAHVENLRGVCRNG